MSQSLLARVGVTALSVVSLLTMACSQESPSSPSAPAGDVGDLAARPEKRAGPEKPAGRYELIWMGYPFPLAPLQPILSPVPVNSYLTLGARVFDQASGLRVKDGTVTFEYCSPRGPGDFAPLETCANGEGTWRRWGATEINPLISEARLSFGKCSNPRKIGFRLRYAGGSVADGEDGPDNFEWIAN